MKLQPELFGVTLSLAAYSFAQGLIGVFIPLLMLDAGAPLWQIPAFYMTYAVAKLIINFPIARFVVQHHGVHIAFGLGFAASIFELLALHGFVVSHNDWWLLLAAFCLAAVNASLWLSQHLHISSIVSAASKSSSMATIETINQVLGISAPFIGGLIGAAFGPGWLIALAVTFLLLAFVPLPLIRRLHDAHTREIDATPLRYSVAGVPKRDLFANFSWNIESAIGTLVWPIFLAIEIATYRSIGLISALAGLATVTALWIAGHRGDRGHDRKVLVEAAAISSVINLLRLIPGGPIWVTGVSAGYRGSLAYGQVAWTSSYYGHAKRNGPQWIMAMEMACDAAYLTLWTSLLAIALIASSSTMFTIAFLAAAGAAWGCLALTRSNAEDPPPLPTP